MPRAMQRLVHSLQATHTVASNIASDFRLFFQRTRFGPALRQCAVDGLNMLVRADEDVGHVIYFYGTYEKNESHAFLSEIRKDDICIDIGANVGFYSLMMASRLPNGVVHTFEPVLSNHLLLSINILINKLSNVIANCSAVGDSVGTTPFVVTEDGAFSSFMDTGRNPVDTRLALPVTTIDHYVEQRELPRVDCIKVDVEGAEGKVLSGAHGLLSNPKKRPRLVMMELYDPMLACYGSSTAELLKLMDSYGYSPFITKRVKLVRLGDESPDPPYNVHFRLK